MKKFPGLLSSLSFIAILFFLYACNKDTSLNDAGKSQRVSIFLTDDPFHFDEVNIDIQMVEINVDTSSSAANQNNDNDQGDDDHQGDEDHDSYNSTSSYWDTLDIRPGVYNLLDFRNGADTLFASGTVFPGKVRKIRITLGTNNSVMIDSVTYPLQLRSNTVTILVDDRYNSLDPNNFRLWLDIDCGRSIIRLSNNHFELRPYIRAFVPDQFGAVAGKVLPHEAEAIISVYNSNDTLIAIPNRDGWFKIRGINGNSVDMLINATANNYKDTLIQNITINPGDVTNVGVITLHQ